MFWALLEPQMCLYSFHNQVLEVITFIRFLVVARLVHRGQPMLEQHWSGRMDLDPRGTAVEHATLGLSVRV